MYLLSNNGVTLNWDQVTENGSLPFESFGRLSYLHFIATMDVCAPFRHSRGACQDRYVSPMQTDTARRHGCAYSICMHRAAQTEKLMLKLSKTRCSLILLVSGDTKTLPKSQRQQYPTQRGVKQVGVG